MIRFMITLFGIFDVFKILKHLIFNSVLNELRDTLVSLGSPHFKSPKQFVIDGNSRAHSLYLLSYMLARMHQRIKMTIMIFAASLASSIPFTCMVSRLRS